MRTSKSTSHISTSSEIGNNNSISYKIIVSIVFDLLECFNIFYSKHFNYYCSNIIMLEKNLQLLILKDKSEDAEQVIKQTQRLRLSVTTGYAIG